MGKYSQVSRQSPIPTRPWAIHPIWRGIGCFMIILIPIMSYAGAVLLVQANARNGWVPVPYELARSVALPFIGVIPYLYANLLAAVVLAVLGFALLTLLYALLYGMVGPSRLGPLDAEPGYQRRPPKRRR